MKMRNLIDIAVKLFVILENNVLHREIADLVWEEFLGLTRQNESELNDYVDDYEDETGETVNYPRARQHERGIELEDQNFLGWLKERIAEQGRSLAAELTKLAENGKIRVWRAIEEVPEWDALKETRDHIHWTRDPEKAAAYFGIGEAGHVTHLIEALMPVGSVDWPATVRANLSSEFGSDEDEITKLPGAPVEIVKTEIVPSSG